MNFSSYLKESTIGSIDSVLSMAKIIIPLMIVMEILKDAKILEKISKKLKPIAKLFDISNESVFPLMIGMVFGLIYGAGIIIESIEEENLKKKDLYIIIIFLVACHAIFEDTFIFVAVGANLWLLFFTRLTVALVVAYFASKVIDRVKRFN
ncbi:nucleoside recognition domain-containing protein [Caproiciproducens sp. MSJ-32]|uniref:nucleoside recognition domain-containing protein n=1 Tax=Caproiciproducens sp. MSJ-32 TaxID=2841527 RepID=UPI001C128F6C|nr:nucleoside recognition domain-containing protein [Caproiciproducens sp. MSJ-32]MBU5455416.1 nucleoside recognition protein [Caproiciproducens sp. MSJ-32]